MQAVKKALRSKIGLAVVSAVASVIGAHMATEWPAIWQAMCIK